MKMSLESFVSAQVTRFPSLKKEWLDVLRCERLGKFPAAPFAVLRGKILAAKRLDPALIRAVGEAALLAAEHIRGNANAKRSTY